MIKGGAIPAGENPSWAKRKNITIFEMIYSC